MLSLSELNLHWHWLGRLLVTLRGGQEIENYTCENMMLPALGLIMDYAMVFHSLLLYLFNTQCHGS